MSQPLMGKPMIKIRSSTIFRFLCGAIGLLAAGLLAMVALMVYPFIFGGDGGPEAKATERKGPAERVRRINVKAAAGAWQVHFWPEVPEEKEDTVSKAQDAEGDFIYVGSIIINEHNSSAIFQRKSSREQFRVPLGGEVYDITLKEVARDQVVATVAGNLVALRKVDTLPPKGAKRTRAPSKRTAATTSGNTSFRLAESRSTSRPTRATAVRRGNQNAARTSSGSSTGSTTNWRRYWAERMRNRQQQNSRNK